MGEKQLEWSRWYLVADSGQPKIRRYKVINGKTVWERYPVKNYRDLATQELEALLRRLNTSWEVERKSAEERYNFDHAFVNIMSIEKYRKHLAMNITDKSTIETALQFLNDYVFKFFIIEHELPDPSTWHRKEDEWGEWLQEQDLSPATIKKIVGGANRFNKFLLEKLYVNMEVPRKLSPIGSQKLAKLEIFRSKKMKVKTKYITSDIYKAVLKAAEQLYPEVIPNIKLCKAFGLRISETLGFDRSKLLSAALVVDEQGDEFVNGQVIRGAVKTDARRVPYWNLTAKESWSLIKAIQPMGPHTLVKRVNEILEPFGHTSHDFRRTFITEALRLHHWKDVMRAAGHKDVRTTMLYDQDDRGISDKLADLDDLD
jgi:integrase